MQVVKKRLKAMLAQESSNLRVSSRFDKQTSPVIVCRDAPETKDMIHRTNEKRWQEKGFSAMIKLNHQMHIG